jgi:hypothetical protein
MQRTLICSISVSALVLVSATAAMARDDIKGSYGFTGTAACLVAPGTSVIRTARHSITRLPEWPS